MNHYGWYIFTMAKIARSDDPSEVRLPLGTCPRVVSAGIGVHGSRPVERYRLPGIWCLHLYRYHATLLIDERRYTLSPCTVTVYPPGVHLEYRFRERSEATYAHFVTPESAAQEETDVQPTPVLSRWEPSRFALLEGALRDAVGWFGANPRRAEARVWDVLWQVAAGPEAEASVATPGMHEGRMHDRSGAIVQEITSAIELRLAEPIRVEALLRELDLGLSYNQVLRVFRKQTGGSIVAYIRQRRVERARHLLRRTSIPIKVVAIQVGVPDLQAFNKLIRQSTGLSPRALREQG